MTIVTVSVVVMKHLIYEINHFVFLVFSIKKKVKKGSGGSKTLPSSSSPNRVTDSPTLARRLPLPTDPSDAIGTAVVKYNYQAQQADELSLVKGTRILILEKSNDG